MALTPQGFQHAIPVYVENYVGDAMRLQLPVHSVVSVDSVSTQVLPVNADRKYGLFINDSDEVIYLKIGAVAIEGTGIRLNANGGSYEMGYAFGNLYQGIINAICVSGGKNLLVFEA